MRIALKLKHQYLLVTIPLGAGYLCIIMRYYGVIISITRLPSWVPESTELSLSLYL